MFLANIPDHIVATVRGLYCGGCDPELGPKFVFFDPLVRVSTARESLIMFSRLRAIFPHSTIGRFEPLETIESTTHESSTRYLMEIIYRIRPSDRGYMMRSHLVVTTEAGVVVGLKEDWKFPINVGADFAPVLHGARRLFGRLSGCG